MAVALPARQDTRICLVTLDEGDRRLPVFAEVRTVGVVAANLIRGIRTVLVVITTVQREDARVIGVAFELILATPAAHLI